MVKIASSDIGRIHDKLDNITEKIIEIAEMCATHEQHLKELNGTVERHDKELYGCYKRIEANKGRIDMARGAIAVIAVLSMVIGGFVSLRTLGVL